MTQIGTLKIETAEGTVEVPVFEESDVENPFLRVETENGTGVINAVDPSRAELPQLRVNTSTGVKAFSTSAGSPVASESLMLWYNFESSGAEDQSGTGNDGTVNGATYLPDGGPNGEGAYSFEGDDSIDVPDSPSLDITDEITISVWTRMDRMPENMSATYPALVNKSNYTYRFGVYQGNTSQQGLRLNYKTSNQFQSDYTIVNGTSEWIHFLVTYDGSEMVFYENSTVVHTASDSVTIDTDDSSIQILGKWEGDTYDTRIYNRALTETEISELYSKTKP
jgi:hypothetical protein